MSPLRSLAVASAAAAAIALAVPAAAPAAEPSDPIATGLAGPLQIDVGDYGQVYVGQSFAGLLTKIRTNGTTKTLVAEPGSVTGVASRGWGVAYTFSGGTEEHPTAALKFRRPNGMVRTVARLYRFERYTNPDADQMYGFLNLSDRCAAQIPAEAGGGYPTSGEVNSNPYALANAPDGGWYVADAGANAILHVSRGGAINVVKVLRRQKAIVTSEAAEANGLPACTVGKTYAAQPVPTDVEVTRRGNLMVSLLPGGPEDASFGARGAVVRISMPDGHSRVISRGFLGATNLALAPGGKIYVAELFGGRVSMLHDGMITTVADLPSPAAVEYWNGKLYVSTDVFANGSIVKIEP